MVSECVVSEDEEVSGEASGDDVLAHLPARIHVTVYSTPGGNKIRQKTKHSA